MGIVTKNFIYKWLFVAVRGSLRTSLLIKIMVEDCDHILLPWEIETYIQDLQPSNFEDIGTKRWLEFHKRLLLLSQQSVLEIRTLQEEAVIECFISLKKISVLIHEVIQINVWKQKVFPILVEMNKQPKNTFLMYSIFYHEGMAASMLENILFHSASAETIDDHAIDLIDYSVANLTSLLYSNTIKHEIESQCIDSWSNELLEKKKELEFEVAMKCVSILRYMAEFSNNLPLCALSRMLSTHDVPYLLTELIETQPWRKSNANGEQMIYNGKWEKVDKNETERMCKVEGQVWIGLREILLDPRCAPYYKITDFRMSHLTKLQKYLHEHVLDQIAPLIELKRWLCQLNVTSQPLGNQNSVIVEMLPEIKSAILSKYNKKWIQVAKHHSKSLFNNDMDYIKSMAKVLSEAYDLTKLESIEMKKCFVCEENAEKRCSKCKEAWYCGRECQVKDWAKHKEICYSIIKSQEAYGIKD